MPRRRSAVREDLLPATLVAIEEVTADRLDRGSQTERRVPHEFRVGRLGEERPDRRALVEQDLDPDQLVLESDPPVAEVVGEPVETGAVVVPAHRATGRSR